MQTDSFVGQLRICIVAHALRRQDGQGRVNLEIVKAALERRHEVTVLATVCDEELQRHPKVRFVRTGSESIPTQLLRNIHFANQSARWLEANRQNFDVIQANGFVTWAPCDVVAVHFVHSAWLKSPLFPFRNSWSPKDWYQLVYSKANARWEQKAFRSAKEIVAVSRKTAQEVCDTGATRKPVRVIYNGVDLVEFHPGPAARKTFDLPTDVPLALFVGDIRTPRKNLPTVLKALQQTPEVHLVVAAAKEGSPYIQLAERMGLAHRVHFLGKTTRVSDLMRSADLMVFPSRYEAHPLVVIEALACGLPSIVSATIARGEDFADACVLVPDADDADRIATEIRRLLAYPDARVELSRRGERIASRMSWENTARQYTALYEEMAAARSKIPGGDSRVE